MIELQPLTFAISNYCDSSVRIIKVEEITLDITIIKTIPLTSKPSSLHKINNELLLVC